MENPDRVFPFPPFPCHKILLFQICFTVDFHRYTFPLTPKIPMIKNAVIAQIEQMLDSNLSLRKIAARLGVSHTTVSRVASRKRNQVDLSDQIDEAQGPIVRCPKCGGRTRLPCAYCQITKSKRVIKITPSDLQPAEEFQVELVGEHRRRYEKIRAWRAAQPNPYFTDIPDNWPWRTNEPIVVK